MVSCFGFLVATKSQCGAFINTLGRSATEGVPTSCFKGIRQHPNGINGKFAWFYNTYVAHTWSVDQSNLGAPGHSPRLFGRFLLRLPLKIMKRSSWSKPGFVLEEDETLHVQGPNI